MSPTALADAHASDNRDHKLNLLGLSAELRNAIYQYTFDAETESTLTPHPLTQVSRQIRRESLKLYYASVTYLKVPVQTLEQIATTRNWLDEVDLAAYPVLPTIEFSPSWLSDKPCSTVVFTREVKRPAEELADYVAWAATLSPWDLDNLTVPERALVALYMDCLGCYRPKKDSINKIPDQFRQFLKEEGGTWVARRLHYPFTSRRDQEGLRLSWKFIGVAARAEGRDWDKNDLKNILEYFERRIQSSS